MVCSRVLQERASTVRGDGQTFSPCTFSRFYAGDSVLADQNLFRSDVESASSQMKDGRIRLAFGHVVPGDNHAEAPLETKPVQHGLGALPAGRTGQSHG